MCVGTITYIGGKCAVGARPDGRSKHRRMLKARSFVRAGSCIFAAYVKGLRPDYSFHLEVRSCAGSLFVLYLAAICAIHSNQTAHDG